MSYETLRIEHCGASAWLWMSRPDLHNALNETLIAELTDAFVALDRDPAVSVIVIAGVGESFSVGVDLNWVKRQDAAPPEANLLDARKLATLFSAVSMCSTPTLARVQGATLGVGIGLALACDICIASTNAQFERIGAERAREIGLIHEVTEPDALDAKVWEVIDGLFRIAMQCATPEGSEWSRTFLDKGQAS
ncbi:enoyl-CoA hydratase/isomerase family protein [Burkholderia sp. Ac-20345]|uniref:enoyl-CoA hydratase-related protein n=1 Tax=Burkholderia sp. Ac-20345 TaxID=2703891 RepID=UPI00197BECFF|nr:enoyl-CoA hydratase-related protein [Burkholderia sp. Ac-20345]MBN3780361.1 enoyl-CoA hydratase/isomerase family protein [Burkholderia sp. Ac-20345]